VPIAGRDNGDRYDLSATPNTAVAIAIPGDPKFGTAPKSANLFFVDGSGAYVAGRYAYAIDDALDTVAIDDDDTILGRFPPWDKEIPVPLFATHLVIASSTASAMAELTWLYEVA
jgi:hypothetical protein